jgi:hypothetical protein
MPPKACQLKRNLVEQEGRIQLAIQALNYHEIQSTCQAAEVFNVPETTLQARLKGRLF